MKQKTKPWSFTDKPVIKRVRLDTGLAPSKYWYAYAWGYFMSKHAKRPIIIAHTISVLSRIVREREARREAQKLNKFFERLDHGIR